MKRLNMDSHKCRRAAERMNEQDNPSSWYGKFMLQAHDLGKNKREGDDDDRILLLGSMLETKKASNPGSVPWEISCAFLDGWGCKMDPDAGFYERRAQVEHPETIDLPHHPSFSLKAWN